MQYVALTQLVTDTVFDHNCKKYKKGFLDKYEKGKRFIECYPKLGGKFQDSLGEFIEENTTVGVE